MSSRSARKRNSRRDRRKAKQSGYIREGRSRSNKAGHGGSGQKTKGKSKINKIRNISIKPERKANPLFVSFYEVLMKY